MTQLDIYVVLTRWLCTRCKAAYHSDEKQATICNKCYIADLEKAEGR